jgi:hypothetical protein
VGKSHLLQNDGEMNSALCNNGVDSSVYARIPWGLMMARDCHWRIRGQLMNLVSGHAPEAEPVVKFDLIIDDFTRHRVVKSKVYLLVCLLTVPIG